MAYIICGSLGFAAHVLESLPSTQVAGVVDHDPARIGQQVCGYKVWPIEQLLAFPAAEIIVATLDFGAAVDHLLELGIGPERMSSEVRWQPFFLQLEPTARCNLACHYCSRETLPETRKAIDLSYERFCQWMRPLTALKRLHLQGLGEPLLNRDLARMISYCNDSQIAVSVTTNGMVSLERAGSEAIFSLYKLVVSIDQANEQGDFLSRSGGSLGKLEETLDWYIRNCPLASNTRLAFNYVLCGGDESGIAAVAEIASRYRPQELHFQLAENWFIPSQPEYLDGQQMAIAAAENEQRFLDDIAAYRADLRPLGIQVSYTGSAARLGRCYWPSAGAFVSVDGYVTPCCIRMDPGCYNLGRIGIEGGLHEIWFSKAYQRFRRDFMSGDGCSVCDSCPA